MKAPDIKIPGRPRTLASVLGAALLLGVLAAGALGHGRYYNNDDEIETSHPSWMGWLPDDISLARLSIPGTHDTMSLHGGDLVETQELGLRQQLDAGIRALDIRARCTEDRFAIHHGEVFQKAMFGDDVLKVVGEFLDAHPTETILMRLGAAGVPEEKDCTKSFDDVFLWYRDIYDRHIWRPPSSFAGSSVPSLGQVRGKIVILQNWVGSAFHGLNYPHAFEVQDVDRIGGIAEINDKWEFVRRHLQAADAGDPGTVYINYLSSFSTGAYPLTIAGGTPTATGVNHFALHWLFERNVAKRTGVMMMDFPGAGLIDAIIAHNFRLASDVRELAPDFYDVVDNLAYSLDGDAIDRGAAMKGFLEHVLPGEHWNVVVSKEGWGYDAGPTAGLHAVSSYVDDYKLLAFNSHSGRSEVSTEDLGAFVDGQLGSLSDGAQARANQLAARLRAWYPGQYWAAVVRKGDGGRQNWGYGTRTPSYKVASGDYIYVAWGWERNDPPIADAGGPYVVDEGSEIVLDASGSSDPDPGDTLQYRWALDGSFGAWSDDPTFRFVSNDNRESTVSVEVTDSKHTSSATVSLRVRNVAPEVDELVDVQLDEGGEVTLSGAFFDAGGLDTHTVEVAWGDGTAPTAASVADDPSRWRGQRFETSHVYRDDDPTGTAADDYTVTVTVTDDDGGSDTETATVTVANVAPVLDPLTAASIRENDRLILRGVFSEVGVDDDHTVEVDWGDGSPKEPATVRANSATEYGFAAVHAYVDDDPTETASDDYTVTVTVTDDDGGSDTETATVTVANVAPVLGPVASASIRESDSLTLAGELSDVGSADTHSVSVYWGDGSGPTAAAVTRLPSGKHAFSAAHVYLDDDPTGTAADDYTVTVTVTDDDGGSDTETATVTVANVAPVLDPVASASIPENEPVTIAGELSDVGSADTQTVSIDWGDGSEPTAASVTRLPSGKHAFSASHTYADDDPSGTTADDYTVTVAATDDDGGSATAPTTITVQDVAPRAALDRVVDESGAVIGLDVPVALVGLVLTAAGHLIDQGTEDTHRASMAWGDGETTAPAVTQSAGSAIVRDRHTYSAPVDAVITLTVVDDDTLSGRARLSIRVADAATAVAAAVEVLLEPIAAASSLDQEAKEALTLCLAHLEGTDGGADENGALDLLARGNRIAGLEKILLALRILEGLTAPESSLTEDQRGTLERLESFLALTAKSVYLEALAEARAATQTPATLRKVAEATVLGDRAGTKLGSGDHVGAVADYQDAVRVLQGS